MGDLFGVEKGIRGRRVQMAVCGSKEVHTWGVQKLVTTALRRRNGVDSFGTWRHIPGIATWAFNARRLWLGVDVNKQPSRSSRGGKRFGYRPRSWMLATELAQLAAKLISYLFSQLSTVMRKVSL
jgi:hypothetical protein